MGNGNGVRAGMTVAKTISYYAESVGPIPADSFRVADCDGTHPNSKGNDSGFRCVPVCEEWSLQAMELPLHYRSVGH